MSEVVHAPVAVVDSLDDVLYTLVALTTTQIGGLTTTQLTGWKTELNKHAIAPVQQFSYTTGKNSTDSALIIDAMDLLYSGNVDGFAIVSSDSDFTRLANRLRESGKTVYGVGRKTTRSENEWLKTVALANFIMKMRSGRKSRGADMTDCLSPANSRPGKDPHRAQVGIARRKAALVGDPHLLPMTTVPSGGDYDSVRGSVDFLKAQLSK